MIDLTFVSTTTLFLFIVCVSDDNNKLLRFVVQRPGSVRCILFHKIKSMFEIRRFQTSDDTEETGLKDIKLLGSLGPFQPTGNVFKIVNKDGNHFSTLGQITLPMMVCI